MNVRPILPSNFHSVRPTSVLFGQFHLQNFRPSGEASVHYGQSHLSLFHLSVRLQSVSLYLTFHTSVCPSGFRPLWTISPSVSPFVRLADVLFGPYHLSHFRLSVRLAGVRPLWTISPFTLPPVCPSSVR